MKFKCAKDNLLSALSIVTRALSNKANTPILTGIYIKAKENDIEFQANNNEIGIITHIEAEVAEQGELVLSGRYLQEVSRRLPGDTVELEFSPEEGIANISSEKAKFALIKMNTSEFPIINKLEGENNFTLPSTGLLKLIKKTINSCSTGDDFEMRPIFSGCYLTIDEGKLTMVATNARRMSVEKDDIPLPTDKLDLIIPAKVLGELMYIIDSDVPVDVKISCTNNKISFECEQTYIASRLIEGQYPPYQKVYPKSSATTATVNTKELMAAVNRISLISRSNNNNTIRFEFSAGQVRMSSANPDIGNADETLGLNLEGPDLDISFNVIYLTDALKVIEGEECSLYLNRNIDPFMIKDSGDENYTYILTPVRTSN